MITVTGRTWEYKNRLKEMRGQWNGDARRWEFWQLSQSELAEVRNMVGCIVSDVDTPAPLAIPAPEPSDDLDELIAALFANEKNNPPNHRINPPVIYGDDPRYLNYFKDHNPRAFFGFSSLATMCDYIDAIPDHMRRNEHSNGWKPSNHKWDGSRDMPEALRLARNGWSQGYDNAAELVELLGVEHATKRRRSFDLAGGSVSVGRMLSGNPAHMLRRPKQPGRKIVTLFVEAVASAAIEAETMITRAAIVAAIADILEREGYSCEIVSTDTRSVAGFGSKPAVQIVTTIKTAGEKFNLNDIVFALGHPSYLRRLAFACVSSTEECRSIYDNQGTPGEAFNKHHIPGRNEFYIRHLSIANQHRITGDTLRERALSMLPMVEPINLPIKILEQK